VVKGFCMPQLKVCKAVNGCWDLVEHYLSPIRHLFDLPGVTEVEVNRFDRIFIEQHGQTKPVAGAAFEDEDQVALLIHQIANALGQAVDKDSHPILDARLLDGTRVCGALYPVSTHGSSLSFRIFPKEQITAGELVQRGSLTCEMLDFLKLSVICRANILVSGGTGSGKTTLLNVLSQFIAPADRVVTVEDTRELRITGENHVSLEAPTRRKQADAQTVDLSFLIKTTLRLNPTRVLVGEIRDGHAATAFLHAVNTGHNASSTIHANGPEDALTRVQTLVAGQGSLPFDVVKAQVRANLNLLIHAEKTPNHGRRIVSITEIQDGRCVQLWRWSYRQGLHVREPANSGLYCRLEKYGVQVPN
jgi:pilus assembly protein CpaF